MKKHESDTDKKKILSFALWGDLPIYNVGAIKNAELAKEIYPGWICRYHVASGQKDTIEKLSQFDNVEIVNMEVSKWAECSNAFANATVGGAVPSDYIYWKVLPFFDEDVEVFFSRDVDSRISRREKAAVDEFINSDKEFHIIRDHPGHCTGTPIIGSMYGMKTSIELDLQNLIDDYKKQDRWPLIDQWFLMKSVYPLIKDRAMVHHDESCAAGCQIPKNDPLYWGTDGENTEHRMLGPRSGTNVIGKDYLEVIGIEVDENDIPGAENQGKLKKWIERGIYWWKK